MTAPARRDRGMTKRDVALLLSFMAAYDQRTIGDADVEAWHMVAVPAGWTLPYARRAVVEFVTEATGDRLLPGHITKAIRERQALYVASFLCPPLPNGMRDTDEQTAWMRAQRAAYVTDRMDRWAAGEDVTR
jgi:hypothetical protein